MSFLAEIFEYIKSRRKFFLVPVLLTMLLLGGLLVFAQGSAIAPFIYTLF